jgi:copper(I)-binding protein
MKLSFPLDLALGEFLGAARDVDAVVDRVRRGAPRFAGVRRAETARSATARTRAPGLLSLALVLALGAAPALAQQIKAGDLVIEKPWARATPKGAAVGAGYLTIRNNGDTPDKLTGGTADFAGVEVHEMSMAGGVMKMREVEGGLEIPAHGTVTLAPSGYHLMFTGLKQPLRKGEVAKATLSFAHAGSVAVEFPVRGVGASESGSGDGMKGMKM